MKPLQALVVDNQRESRDQVYLALRNAEFRCRAVLESSEAVTAAVEDDLDVVVAVVKDREGLGYELVRKTIGRADSPLVVVLMNSIDLRLGREMLEMGAELVLFKPVDTERMIESIMARLDERGAASPRDSAEAFQLLNQQVSS